jgi:poly(A) polymerase
MTMAMIPWTAERRRVLLRLQRSPCLRRLQAFAAPMGLSLFVVGGALRDVCLGRDVHDLDVVMAGDVMGFARAFADALGAAYVPLDARRGEARVVYRQRTTLDFARLRGRDIVDDLRQRDFTMNALACPLTAFLQEAEPAFIDPLGGWPDLQARLIRMASPQSFAEDPLRLLRAFRLAAALEFALEASTRQALKPAVPRLADVAAERVQSELLQLFAGRHSTPQVVAMAQVGVLDVLFPELGGGEGTRPGGWPGEHRAHALRTYRAVEELINAPASVAPTMAEPIARYVQVGERAALLKWAALLHGARPARGRPCCSDAEGAAAAWEQVAGRLKLSRARTDYVRRLIAHQRRPVELARRDDRGGLALPEVHRWFKELGEDVLGVFVLALGEALARQPAKPHADGAPALERLAARLWALYRERILPVLQGPRLVTGDDLQTLFGLTPGPSFKVLLDELEVAQVEGRVSTRAAALRWLRQRLQGP